MKSRFGYDTTGQFVDLTTGLPPTEEQKQASDKVYYAMLDADSAFQEALVAKYKRKAGDMRYRTNDLPEDIKALALAYQAAVEAWRETWKA